MLYPPQASDATAQFSDTAHTSPAQQHDVVPLEETTNTAQEAAGSELLWHSDVGPTADLLVAGPPPATTTQQYHASLSDDILMDPGSQVPQYQIPQHVTAQIQAIAQPEHPGPMHLTHPDTTVAVAAGAPFVSTINHDSIDSTKKEAKEGKTGGNQGDPTYVLRIHEMLEDSDKEGNTHIVSWQPHGRAFRVHNESLFVETIMPRYFKAKIGSFRRWLRAWGFARMTEGKDRGAWYHRYFIRGVTSLCKDMTRQQMAQAMMNWPPTGQVADFYGTSSGSALTEKGAAASLPGAANQNNVPLVKNPKRLRGTILEDLRQMLEDAETEGHVHVVSWMPHGRAFRIHNKKQFQGLMSRYFKTAKITHLSDTLRIWGFQRLKNPGRDKGCYYHRFFVKGDPSQSRHLTRVQMKESMANWPPPEGEPDLYRPLLPTQHPAAAATAMGTGDSAAASLPVLYPAHQHQQNSQPAYAAQAVGPGQPGSEAGGGGVQPGAYRATPMPPPGHPEYQINPPTNVQMPELHTTPGQAEPPGSNRGDGTYVLRLHEMLEAAEKEGFQHIVSWQPHGRAFRIHKEKDFVEHIMPRYFKAKMGSFLRWCRAWGFVRMTEGRDRGAWYHRFFVRGVTHLSRNMTRQQMLKAMEDWLPAGHVPNFYACGKGAVLSENRETPIAAPPNVTCKNPKRLRGTVPEDLRQMLDDAIREGNTLIVSWLPHGKAFKVHDKKAFTQSILSRYFKASKYTYFSDALRIWGWQRIKAGRDKGAYYHRNFIKDQPHLTRHLTRIQMKESMTPWPPADDGEPNLYTNQPDSPAQQPAASAVPQAAVDAKLNPAITLTAL